MLPNPAGHGDQTLHSVPILALAPSRAEGTAGPSPRRSPPPRRPGTGPRPAGLTLSWSHRTLLRFSSGARFRSRPINSSNNCAAEIMVLLSGGYSHQPWHPPKKTPATPSPTSSAGSRAEKASSKQEPIRQNGRCASAFPACRARACAHGARPSLEGEVESTSAGSGAGPVGWAALRPCPVAPPHSAPSGTRG